MADKDHHVHFSGGNGLARENNIMISPQRHGQIDVYLGFLQHKYRYWIEFSIPWNLCNNCDGKTSEPAIITGPSNPHCHVLDLGYGKDGLKLKVELAVHSEHILKQIVHIACCRTGTPLKIHLNARVLMQGQGVPVLRNGIHTIGQETIENEVSGSKSTASMQKFRSQKKQ